MKRKPDEPYEDYKLRRDSEQAATRYKLRGKVFWPSQQLGTYRRKKSEK